MGKLMAASKAQNRHASVEELCPGQCQQCSVQGTGVPSIEGTSIERLKRQCPQLTGNFCIVCSTANVAEICVNECSLCVAGTAASNTNTGGIKHGQNLLDLVPEAYKGVDRNDFTGNAAVDTGAYWNGDNIGLQQYDDLAAGNSPVETVLVIGNQENGNSQVQEQLPSEDFNYLQAFQQQQSPDLPDDQTDQPTDPANLAYFGILTDLVNSEEDQNVSNQIF
uniref:Uncharacterized protein n=1 Tax=Ditylenchus dipsaci TaxID=166011 RepID=A0A915CLI5_9BILA